MNDKIELTAGMGQLFGIEKDRIVKIVQEIEELAFQYNHLQIFDFAKKIKEHYAGKEAEAVSFYLGMIFSDMFLKAIQTALKKEGSN